MPDLARRAILAVPEGTLYTAIRARGWNEACGGPDMAFFDTMVAEIESRDCVDPRAVFATGFSWGARITNALACCRGDRLRAIAPASGSGIELNTLCPTPRLPAVRVTYGTRDSKIARLETTGRFFRAAHHCGDTSDPIAPEPCVSWRGCAHPVVECVFRGGLHQLPHDYASATWAFFASLLP